MDTTTRKRLALFDEFEKTNPMPDMDRKVNPECKEAYMINKPSMNFEYEYTKDEDTIATLEDNDVDVSQYITEESLEEEDRIGDECQDKLREHQLTCSNIWCQWHKKQFAYVNEHSE
jgi:hypothetical protein